MMSDIFDWTRENPVLDRGNWWHWVEDVEAYTSWWKRWVCSRQYLAYLGQPPNRPGIMQVATPEGEYLFLRRVPSAPGMMDRLAQLVPSDYIWQGPRDIEAKLNHAEVDAGLMMWLGIDDD